MPPPEQESSDSSQPTSPEKSTQFAVALRQTRSRSSIRVPLRVELRALYDLHGLSVEELSDFYGLSRTMICNQMARYGIRLRSQDEAERLAQRRRIRLDAGLAAGIRLGPVSKKMSPRKRKQDHDAATTPGPRSLLALFCSTGFELEAVAEIAGLERQEAAHRIVLAEPRLGQP